jgi:glycosyltransferase involved in cell wall biosynthesis
MADSPSVPAQPRAKLVFVNRYFHPDESATSRITSDLAFRLAQLGIDVAVVTSRQLYEDPRANLPAFECARGVNIHRVATARLGRGNLVGRAVDYLSFHIAAAAKLLGVLSAGDVVVAETDPPMISVAVSHVARLKRAHLVNWLQDLFPEVATALGMSLGPAWLGKLLRGIRDRSLRRAVVNVVLGDRMRDQLIALELDPRRIRVIPNWSDILKITPLPTRQSQTRRAQYLDDKFVIGYSGNLGRAHEFETLLDAARLLRQDPRFAFLLTGAGAKVQALRRAVEADSLGNFHFMPLQPPELLADSLAASDVHVISLLPELEGLIVPSKLYGVLAAGRPSVFIGAADGEVASVIREHQCGITVAVGDSARLASELVSMIEAPAQLQAMGRNARSLAESHYTAEHAAETWRQMLVGIAPAAMNPTREGAMVPAGGAHCRDEDPKARTSVT